jgi:hypothetical protein
VQLGPVGWLAYAVTKNGCCLREKDFLHHTNSKAPEKVYEGERSIRPFLTMQSRLALTLHHGPNVRAHFLVARYRMRSMTGGLLQWRWCGDGVRRRG